LSGNYFHFFYNLPLSSSPSFTISFSFPLFICMHLFIYLPISFLFSLTVLHFLLTCFLFTFKLFIFTLRVFLLFQ
jgi:hypothetical protein